MKTLNSKISSIDEEKREKLLKTVSDTYQAVVNEYERIFLTNCYLPTKTSPSLIINGFTERNLTFNFCHSYLSQHHNAIVWQEIPIKGIDRQHVDSIIIDNDWVIFLEAKRLYDITYFESLLSDLQRIKVFHSYIPLPPKHPKNKAVVLLADQYFHGDTSKGEKYKTNYYDNFFTSNDIIKMPEIDKLSKPLRKDIDKISNIRCKFEPITISKNNYNINKINITKDIYYTIYCGVYFIE